MTYDLILALCIFAFVSSITPGPNNLMLMASGANFGFVRTVPHMLGVGLGFVFMVILVGTGFIQVFATYPISHTILKGISVVYLIWLALKIAGSATTETKDAEEPAPFTFLQAAAFQWVNPKSWAMALTAITVYTPDTSLATIALVACVFGCINIPAVSSWTLLGQGISRWLRNPGQRKLFNWAMAALLILSLYPVLFP
ncbi:MAG: LysE family translocator [Paracoccaceae bacterium]